MTNNAGIVSKREKQVREQKETQDEKPQYPNCWYCGENDYNDIDGRYLVCRRCEASTNYKELPVIERRQKVKSNAIKD